MLNKTFSALADNNRQKIIDLLKKREMSVSDIVSHLNITMATLSHHLDILKRADLISGRRDGQKIIYSLNFSVIQEVEEKIVKFLKIKNKK
ncbi:winged helix-turn-helix transcriptional regulator [Candidatus Falkowbacteria bacterium]|uniref:Transcriptional regulator n=1 Tax=Candidatus Buchananbacteria bacterium CG10_big_fil_rev_8_21_14_0_10_33_19 TaxID=1974525 RepID=A0A2H0W513_9BACT|nr:winged helix-turn-helix transcriptional regulator [Candidatus Falkowbacteria bacterium]PIS06452.1 MAG: transcriptional regulator [Candidatus Buchananbacteria bacterium CG10_big_fil_rev_8_21_14_0_10_33_19]